MEMTSSTAIGATTLSKEDRKVRSNGIGSSEIAMLVEVDGKPLSPWGGGKYELWDKKVNNPPRAEPTDAMKRGIYYEPSLIEWYSNETGLLVIKPPSVRHHHNNIIVDSIDGLAFTHSPEAIAMSKKKEFTKEDLGWMKKNKLKGLEIKMANYFGKDSWGEPGTDEVPDYYNVQCQWHCEVWDLKTCDIGVDWGEGLRKYKIKRDIELFDMLQTLAEDFWKNNVEKKIAPELNNSHYSLDHIKKNLKQKRDDLKPATEEIVIAMDEFKKLNLRIKDDEFKKRGLEIQIKEFIGEDAGVESPGTNKKITFKKTKDGEKIDWQRIAMNLNPTADLIKENTDKKEGYRVFRPGKAWMKE